MSTIPHKFSPQHNHKIPGTHKRTSNNRHTRALDVITCQMSIALGAPSIAIRLEPAQVPNTWVQVIRRKSGDNVRNVKTSLRNDGCVMICCSGNMGLCVARKISNISWVISISRSVIMAVCCFLVTRANSHGMARNSSASCRWHDSIYILFSCPSGSANIILAACFWADSPWFVTQLSFPRTPKDFYNIFYLHRS